jgi:hypothetical protein
MHQTAAYTVLSVIDTKQMEKREARWLDERAIGMENRRLPVHLTNHKMAAAAAKG